ncbi:MAG: hypothetical protein LBR13_07340, partial [Dysgonamonadaceae bacterium]|nr:hypothetical protein [Dysgonamonadaceae bacterium]
MKHLKIILFVAATLMFILFLHLNSQKKTEISNRGGKPMQREIGATAACPAFANRKQATSWFSTVRKTK